jgi:glycerol-3-phosphate dehydrogenase
LLGGKGFTAAPSTNEPSHHEHLGLRYGTLADELRLLIADDATLGETLVPGLPYLRAEAVYAVRAEMARTLDDVLARRTRARLLARDASAAVADEVAALIGPDLGWDAAAQAAAVDAYRASVTHERVSADLPEIALDARLGP